MLEQAYKIQAQILASNLSTSPNAVNATTTPDLTKSKITLTWVPQIQKPTDATSHSVINTNNSKMYNNITVDRYQAIFNNMVVQSLQQTDIKLSQFMGRIVPTLVRIILN